jgi:hypothetical protein
VKHVPWIKGEYQYDIVSVLHDIVEALNAKGMSVKSHTISFDEDWKKIRIDFRETVTQMPGCPVEKCKIFFNQGRYAFEWDGERRNWQSVFEELQKIHIWALMAK